MEYSPRYHD